jgi:beta-lactamase superfamily II metal-dependent hydrolase
VPEPIFRVEMLPARQGDALWIEYGDARRPTRILIDVGTRGTYRVVKERAQKVAGEPVLELLVVTHVDSDHVGGAPKLVVDGELNLQAREVWFNGREQIERRLGPVEGEILSAAIAKRGWRPNTSLPRQVAVVSAPTLPEVTLPGGMTLTLLSPTPAELERLLPVWLDAVRDAGLLDGEEGALEEAARRRGVTLGDGPPNVDALAAETSEIDTAPANGSTIAFLAEYEGRSCLFGGDAHPNVLSTSIKRLLKKRRVPRLELSALKVPHHGSEHNVTEELAGLVQARRYLFSTDGTQTEHPHPQAVARILKSLRGEAELVFNYKTRFTKPWADRALRRDYPFTPVYPPEGTAGITVDLEPV